MFQTTLENARFIFLFIVSPTDNTKIILLLIFNHVEYYVTVIYLDE